MQPVLTEYSLSVTHHMKTGTQQWAEETQRVPFPQDASSPAGEPNTKTIIIITWVHRALKVTIAIRNRAGRDCDEKTE